MLSNHPIHPASLHWPIPNAAHCLLLSNPLRSLLKPPAQLTSPLSVHLRFVITLETPDSTLFSPLAWILRGV